MNHIFPISRTPERSDPQWTMPWAWVFLCGLLLIASGCNISTPKNQPRVHDIEDIALNAEQMRRRVRALVQPMSGVIVAAADQIMAGTTDRAIRREALLWKIEAVPALRESLFLPSPLAAIADTWVFTFQMTDYFENGRGAKALGEASAVGVSTSKHLEAEIARMAASVTHSGDVSKAREEARKLAAEHPIWHSIAGRDSVATFITESKLAESLSTDEAVGNIVVTVEDLHRRIAIYGAQLLEQSRWQAELFAMDQAREYQLEKAVPLAERAVKTAGEAVDDLGRVVPAVERAVSTLEKAMPLVESAVKSAGRATDALDRAIPAIERSLGVFEKAPGMITAEREATIKALSAEVTRTIAFVQEERVAILKQVTNERTVAVRDLSDAVSQERRLLAQEIDAITLKAVDRAFLRAAQLCAGSLVAVFLGIVLLMLVARRMFFGSVQLRLTGPS